MKSEIIKQEKTVVEIKVTFPQVEMEEQFENTYKNISKNANIKGFRKGKVPRMILERYYPRNAILPEVAENILTKSLQELVEEYDLTLVSDPSIKLEKLELGSDFVVDITFNVEPDFELPNLEDITLTKTVIKITDEMVMDELKAIQESYPKTVPTYEDRPLVTGDIASVKYTTEIYYSDSTTHNSDGEFKSDIQLVKGYTRPEFLENLVGKKPGDIVKVEINYSPDVSAKTKGRKIVKSIYNIEILGILKEEATELTDEFVTELTQGDLKSVEALKADIRTRLESLEDSRAQDKLKADIMEKISTDLEIELPQVMVSRERENIKKKQETECEREHISLEEFLKKNDITQEENEKKIDKIAQQTVKNTLILSRFVRDNDITLDELDYQKEVVNAAMKLGVAPKQITDGLMKNEQAFDSFKESVLMKKALDILVSKINVAVNSVTRENFAKTLEKMQETFNAKVETTSETTKNDTNASTADVVEETVQVKPKSVTKSKTKRAATKDKTEDKTGKEPTSKTKKTKKSDAQQSL